LFTQEDPIGLGGGLNLYGYADGDPINNADPFGLSSCPQDADDEELAECEKREAKEAADRAAYRARVMSCTQGTPGFNAMAALSPVGLLNLKMGLGRSIRLEGSSAWTSIDRQFPDLPGANRRGGIAVRRVGSGAIKTAGRLGTGAAVISTFATTYVVTTIARCALEAREP
jgi:uncharacterized protein RhaS with RHS repeats